MLNIILIIKRTQVHCTQMLSTLFTCLHVMINTDVYKQNEMQTSCQQRNKSLKRWPLNFDSLITASKWTSCNAEWQNKISSLCLNTAAGYSEEAPSILWVNHSYAYQYLLALVALISRWIQNFRRTAGLVRVLPPVLFMIEALNKGFLCRLFSVSCKQDASDYEQNTPEYTYQRIDPVFSLRIGQAFFFKSFRKRFKAKLYISTA